MNYDLNQYNTDVLRTESTISKVKINPMFLLSVLTIAKCSGTILDQIKKHVFYGEEFDKEKIAENAQFIVGGIEGIGQQFSKLDNESELEIDPRTFHAIIGIATESAELLEALKLNGEMDSVNVLEELGDVMWYSSILVDSNNGNWESILTTNISKLKKRYPEKFTSADAIDRDLDSEREILENGFNPLK